MTLWRVREPFWRLRAPEVSEGLGSTWIHWRSSYQECGQQRSTGKKFGESIDRLNWARGLTRSIKLRDAYPPGADDETKAFVRYWFDGRVRRELASLAIATGEIRSKTIQQALWCAFSRLIIAKQAGVSLALDLAHSRPHRAFARAPKRPFAIYMDAVERVIKGAVKRTTPARGPVPRIGLADARSLPLETGSVNLVFTSPPYLNAIDYLRCSKFSLIWMGHSVSRLREIRSQSIGAEVASSESPTISSVLGHLSCLAAYRDDSAEYLSITRSI